MAAAPIPSAGPSRHLWKSRLALGLVVLALGVAVLVWPGPSIPVAAVLFGVFPVLSGIIELVFALTLDVFLLYM